MAAAGGMLEAMPPLSPTAPAAPVAVVTARDIRALSLPTRGLLRIRHGVYVARELWDAAPPWERYRIRVAAFRLSDPAAILAFESAAVALGLPVFDEPRDIHVFAPERGSSTRYGDICVHTSRDDRQIVDTPLGQATALADTVVDLARVLPPAQALAVADAAASPFQRANASFRTDPGAVSALVAARIDRRGRARVRWVCERMDGRAESTLESMSRAAIEWYGFESPELQREFRYEGHHDRADFLFPSVGAIGEADGWSKYGLLDAAEAASRMAAEKRREDRLRCAGHPFARWEHRDVVATGRLERILLDAGVRRLRAPHPAYLATLSSNPRARRREPPPAPRVTR
ncbi:hypothetical protein [Microbacterium radiodurans]|uniref:Type IV toxin-antitoxin system AbiEi family antitoxin domain-containing protein n=1 Tax=Microbacterium radiodurans TaxID=661398 RepID=A0A5J5ITS4_9MICO|nr:hypothetical protein [Microbacterium radiodurans]KAA9088969.1 hypothetical protein F6B42_00190 [Microbacterium radiodurans]